ncbi:MAG: TRC40/GET3/ArsA family transport-energizing ATPase [Myxococcales bacterium]
MLLIDDLLAAPFKGVLWVFKKIHRAAIDELNARQQSTRASLSELYMQLDTGRISQEQFDAREKQLLDQLDAIEKEKDEAERPSRELGPRGAAMTLPRFFTSLDLRLLFFGGKGGVGKTTCATAAALRWAREAPQSSVLLLSTDPAHSLWDGVADYLVPRNLEVVELDAGDALQQFRSRYGPTLEEIARRGTFLDQEDIRRFLALSLPGMDELFGFLAVARQAESAGHDRVVVDTAPSGHTLRLLAMPGLMRRWLDVLDTLLAKDRFLRQQLAGTYRTTELDRFLDEQQASVTAAERVFGNQDRCRFVPVMLAEELSLQETLDVVAELRRLGIPADEGVVNRLSPSDACGQCAGARGEQRRLLRSLPPGLSGLEWWALPLRPREVRGAELATLWREVVPLAQWLRSGAPSPAAGEPPPKVERAAPAPAASTRLLFFAGKGGVGKTTLACATALRLALGEPRRRVLLFSTDPAPSLADCLDRPVRTEPTPLLPGLDALEMDASFALEALKRQYREQIDAFFGSVLQGFDLPFDRETMERIIDLTPPGLDEIMALTEAMDDLSAANHDLLILDTAPTGHLVRLLEMPELLDDWLRAFFDLFLKYRQVFGIPALAERLVEVSKNVRRFRALLRDPARAAVYATSIPTRMALAETTDLLAACRRLGVHVPVLFLNMLTDPDGCAFCAQRAEEERAVEEELARAVPVPLTRVYRRGEPRGLRKLGRLGDALFQRPVALGGRLDARTSP